MPPALSPEEREAGEKALDPELAFLLTDRGVTLETRQRIGHLGITRLNVFAKIETAEAAFREWTKDD